MKLNKQILEAINRGIKLALDDFDDEVQNQEPILSKKKILNYDPKDDFDFYNSFVDLGLPSGTLWHKYNLGAKKSEDIGNYYAWGETQTKKNFNMNTYKYFVFNNEIPDMLKYNKKDNLTNLQLKDDAAYQYDNRMKMPSKELFKELLNYTILTWEDNYNNTGVSGVLFSKNNLELFIPVSGCNIDTDNETSKFVGENECYLWTSDNYKICGDAWYISFGMYNGKLKYDFYCGRCSDGLPIRPVYNKL